MDDELDVTGMARRTAQSGVGYGEPVVLHYSSKQRIKLVPFFINRSEGTEIAAKIIKDEKRLGVLYRETASISLSDAAARRLYRALGATYAVSEQTGDGNYIVIPVHEGVADIALLEPKAIAQAVARLLTEDRIVEHLTTQNLGVELVSAFRGAIRLRELRQAVVELGEYLERGESDEAMYQAWCANHSWAFGNAYVVKDDARSISATDSVDLLMPSVLGGLRDIVELKRPDMTVLNFDASHRSYYFSAEVSKSIGQCHRYLDVLHEEATHGLRDHPEVVAYHPRATIVIGRARGWTVEQHRALRGLNARMSGITVMTYDHLLAQGQRAVDLLESPDRDADGAKLSDDACRSDEEPF